MKGRQGGRRAALERDVHHITPVRAFAEEESHAREDPHTLDTVVSLCVDCPCKADFGRIPAAELHEPADIEDAR